MNPNPIQIRCYLQKNRKESTSGPFSVCVQGSFPVPPSLCRFSFLFLFLQGSWTPLHADVFGSYSWSANVTGEAFSWFFFQSIFCTKDVFWNAIVLIWFDTGTCVSILTIYAPMIYTVPYVMFLMRADPLRGQVGGGGALEIETFWALRNGIKPLGECHLGPKKSAIVVNGKR